MAGVNLGVHGRRYESAIEMADRAVALNPNHLSHGTAEAGSIELRGSTRKRSGALNVPFA